MPLGSDDSVPLGDVSSPTMITEGKVINHTTCDTIKQWQIRNLQELQKFVGKMQTCKNQR